MTFSAFFSTLWNQLDPDLKSKITDTGVYTCGILEDAVVTGKSLPRALLFFASLLHLALTAVMLVQSHHFWAPRRVGQAEVPGLGEEGQRQHLLHTQTMLAQGCVWVCSTLNLIHWCIHNSSQESGHTPINNKHWQIKKKSYIVSAWTHWLYCAHSRMI